MTDRPDSPTALALAKALLAADTVTEAVADLNDDEVIAGIALPGLLALTEAVQAQARVMGTLIALFAWTQPDLRANGLAKARAGSDPLTFYPGVILRAQLVVLSAQPAPDDGRDAS